MVPVSRQLTPCQGTCLFLFCSLSLFPPPGRCSLRAPALGPRTCTCHHTLLKMADLCYSSLDRWAIGIIPEPVCDCVWTSELEERQKRGVGLSGEREERFWLIFCVPVDPGAPDPFSPGTLYIYSPGVSFTVNKRTIFLPKKSLVCAWVRLRNLAQGTIALVF